MKDSDKSSSILDQWEADAKANERVTFTCDSNVNEVCVEMNDRIVALIDLVRKKDQALHTIKVSAEHQLTGLQGYKLCAEQALALTKKLE